MIVFMWKHWPLMERSLRTSAMAEVSICCFTGVSDSQRWTILHIFHVCGNLCGGCGHFMFVLASGGPGGIGGGGFSHVEMCILESLYFISQSVNILLYLVYWSTNIVCTKRRATASVSLHIYHFNRGIKCSILSPDVLYTHTASGLSSLHFFIWFDDGDVSGHVCIIVIDG